MMRYTHANKHTRKAEMGEKEEAEKGNKSEQPVTRHREEQAINSIRTVN